jgi:hypothetical protein
MNECDKNENHKKGGFFHFNSEWKKESNGLNGKRQK